MKLKNKYFLLRHGQTPYQRDEDKKGVLYPSPENPPVEITGEGKKQIGEAAEILKDKKIDLIFSSDFFRTQQSAGIVSKELGLEVNLDKRLRDLNIGDFHGGPKERYQSYFSDKKEKFVKRPPNGENWNDVRKRMLGFLNDTEGKYENRNILVVSHGDPLWLLAGIVKGLESNDELLSEKHTDLYPDVGQLIIPQYA